MITRGEGKGWVRCDGKNREGKRRGEATSDREKRGLRRKAMKRVRTVRYSTVRT